MNYFQKTSVRMVTIMLLGSLIWGCKSNQVTIPNYAEYQKVFDGDDKMEVVFKGHKVKKYKEFYNGKLCSEYYAYIDKNGNQVNHGRYIGYDDNGIKRVELIYNENIYDGYIIYEDENGNIIAQGTYRSGEPLDGKFFHPHSAEALFTYKDGKAIRYEDNKGHIFAEGTWNGDKMWNGSFFNWDGNIDFYKNGKLIEKKKVDEVAKQFKYYRDQEQK